MIETHRYAEGTRVELQRGPFPMDRRLVGRRGLIVEVDIYSRGRYGVQLDGEDEVRELREEELRPVVDDPKPEHELGSTGPGVG